MTREQNPFITATMSTRLLESDDPRHFRVKKALDSTEADRRQSLPGGTIKLEEQAKGWEFIKQMVAFNFESPRDKQYVGTYLGSMALYSGLFTSANGTSEVMNRIYDIPEVAATEWRQTETGLWVQGSATIDVATNGAHDLTLRHMEQRDSNAKTRRVGRSFGSSAAFLFNYGYPIPTGTPFEAQFAIRERVMDAGFAARKFADESGFFPSTSALTDRDSQHIAQFRRNAPSQPVYSAIEQTLEELNS